MLKTVSSITNAIGALNFKGTWNASTNSPALVSSVGTKGDYYVVGTAGSTNLNGISNWGVGDWATYNGSVWQRVEGGADLNGVNLSVSGTSTLGATTATGMGIGTTGPLSVLTVLSQASSTVSVRTTDSVFGTVTGGTALDCLDGGYSALTPFGVRGSTFTIGTSAGISATYDASGGFILTGSTAQKATGTTWSNPSDQRLKDNIRDYAKGLAELMQVRVREWEYNGKGGTVEGTKGLGVVADEVMVVLPDTVENYEAKLNTDDEEVTPIKKFDATEITWLLVKSMQEQQAQIETLKAEVAALKGV
jgi:hypothetical protein